MWQESVAWNWQQRVNFGLEIMQEEKQLNYFSRQLFIFLLCNYCYVLTPAEPVFLNVKGAQESIPQFYVAWRAGTQIGLSYRPARLGINSWAPLKVYKFGLRSGKVK